MKPKIPAYAVPDPYRLEISEQYGVADASSMPSNFGESAKYGSPLARDIFVDGLVHMMHLHPGGKYRYGDGTASAPAISFAGSTNLGFYRPAANVIAASLAGSEAARIDASGLLLAQDVRFRSGTSFTASLVHNLAADRSYTFDGANGTVWTSGNDGAGSGLDADTVDGSHASAFQPVDATLTAFAGLTIAANSLTIGTGADAFSQTTFAANTFPARASAGSLEAKSITDFGLTLLDDADDSAGRSSLGATAGIWGLAIGGTAADLSTTGGTSQVLKQTSIGGAISVAQLAASDLSNGTTGSGGGVVLATSPTITTPTIASFANATHTHADAAGGGQLSATNVFSAGTIPTARLGSGTANSTTFLRGDQTWATPSSTGDLVYTGTPSDTAVNSVTDIQILTTDVGSVAAGDQLLVSGSCNILNDSGAARVLRLTIDFDGAFDTELLTASLSASASDEHQFFFEAVCVVRTSGSAYFTGELRGYTATASAQGADNPASTGAFYTSGWGHSTNDLTGTVTVSLNVRSASATGTQTFRLHKFTIRKVTPT